MLAPNVLGWSGGVIVVVEAIVAEVIVAEAVQQTLGGPPGVSASQVAQQRVIFLAVGTNAASAWHFSSQPKASIHENAKFFNVFGTADRRTTKAVLRRSASSMAEEIHA